MGDTGVTGARSAPGYERRTVLQAAVGTGLGLLLTTHTQAQDAEPRNARPQAGDHFIIASGERKGATLTPDDLLPGGPPVTVYPVDPQTRVVRDGSRLNQVLLIHLDPAELSAGRPARRHHRGLWRTRRSVPMKVVMYGCGRERARS